MKSTSVQRRTEWDVQNRDLGSNAITSGENVLGIGRLHENRSYTPQYGLVTTSPLTLTAHFDQRRNPSMVFSIPSEVPASVQTGYVYFEAEEEQVGAPGATVGSSSEWPELWHHPEHGALARSLARLLALSKARMARQAFPSREYEVARGDYESPRKRLEALAKQWMDELGISSDADEICTHPAYQQIIGIGPFALPFIFEELQKASGLWFWALKAITGDDPVDEEDKGNVPRMTEAWLQWGRQHGYVRKTGVAAFVARP